MKYCKTVTLKDGRACVLRNGTEEDAQGVLTNFILTHGQTEFLTTYPDEVTFTLDQEKAFLKKMTESDREAEIVAEVGGVIAGTAGIDLIRSAGKTRHRASFGISIEQSWWGLGIGRALTEACIECARMAGYLQLELEAVAANKRAIALYRSVGFAEYGRNPRGFRTRQGTWQENVLMRLELDAPPLPAAGEEKKTVRIGEVGLLTQDVPRLADFYRRLLGLESGSADEVHQFLISEGTALTVYNDGTEKNNRNQNICLAFTVDDIAQAYEKVLALGARIIEAPAKRPWGAVNMSFYDPDNNVVYLRSFPDQG